jgi:hypothetical protein
MLLICPGRHHVSYLVVVILTNYTAFSSCVPATTYKIFGFLLNGTLSKMLTISSCLHRQTFCISQLQRKILGVSVSGLTSSDPASYHTHSAWSLIVHYCDDLASVVSRLVSARASKSGRQRYKAQSGRHTG